MMNQNSTQFLEAFVVIEAYLASISDLAKGVPFVAQVDSLRLTDQTVQAYAEDLKAFARLRNVIVHERGGGAVLAEPNDWAVQRICHVRDMLIQPPTVSIFATHHVLCGAVGELAGQAGTVERGLPAGGVTGALGRDAGLGGEGPE